MTATDRTAKGATDATVALRFEVIDSRAAELGVTTKKALAELLDLDRTSLWRFRRRELNPSLKTAMRVAERLDLPVTDVIERVVRRRVRRGRGVAA